MKVVYYIWVVGRSLPFLITESEKEVQETVLFLSTQEHFDGSRYVFEIKEYKKGE